MNRIEVITSGQPIAELVHGAALDRDIGPQRRQRRVEPWRAVDDDEVGHLQSSFDKIVE